MYLNGDHRDTLFRIWALAGSSAGPCEYNPKQLAPATDQKNAPAFLRRLESAGLLEFIYGEKSRPLFIELTDEGIEVAVTRREELRELLACAECNDPRSFPQGSRSF